MKTTEAFRPTSGDVKEVIGDFPKGAFNFGLYYNKWFYLVYGQENSPNRWKCPTADETKIDKFKLVGPNIRLDNLQISVALFNGDPTIKRPGLRQQQDGKWKVIDEMEHSFAGSFSVEAASALVANKNQNLDRTVASFESLGYRPIKLEYYLLAPLVIGLGGEHPTEKGFRFDWNIGVPFIPASSIKGVVRLAAMVNELNAIDESEEDRINKFCKDIKKDETLPEPMRTLFGSGGDKTAQRGKVIFLDAYPATMPRLKIEIMNCHYKEYLMDGKRGPTEDQDPNPQKFLAVDTEDRSGKPLKFVFRALIKGEVAADPIKTDALKKAFTNALTEHGLGSKTAIGHGRFGNEGAKKKTANIAGSAPNIKTIVMKKEVWEKATLRVEMRGGKQTLIAQKEKKSASTIDMSLISQEIIQKIKKKKSQQADVEVEELGGGNFKILSLTK
jgi:CRISPR-associated protein Cmr6